MNDPFVLFKLPLYAWRLLAPRLGAKRLLAATAIVTLLTLIASCHETYGATAPMVESGGVANTSLPAEQASPPRGRVETSMDGVQPEQALIWPDHVAQIFFWLVAIGSLTCVGWYFLREGHCWKCGRETGLCQHTRYDSPRGE